MSNPKHTPGPWRVQMSEYNLRVRSETALKHDSSVALIPIGEEANARLIAAAPDCLAALELVLNDNRLMNAMNKEQARAIMDAVAKATGGAE